MGRILGLDFGLKRCGLSVTDPLQIIVTSLDTVETSKLQSFFEQYFAANQVDKIVIGMPTHKDGNFTHIKPNIDSLVGELNKRYPNILIDFQDESFSSVDAKNIILQSGVKKKKRQDKALVDKVSAIVILQRYLKHI